MTLSSRDHFSRTRVLMEEMVAGESPIGSPPGAAHLAPTTTPPTPVHGGGGTTVPPTQGRGGSGGDFWSRFFEELTWQGFGKLIIIGILAWGGMRSVTTDTPKNKHEEALAYTAYQVEQEKTQQVLATAKASKGPVVETEGVRPQTSFNCVVANLSQGSNWLNRGGCLTVGTSTNLFGVGTEAPIREITGADFIIRTNDQTAECDSAKTSDRCAGWIAANQTLGSDEGGGGKRRYWFWLTTSGSININA